MRAAAGTILRRPLPLLPRRHFSTTTTGKPSDAPVADGGGSGAKGRTGGGAALGSSSPNAPSRPKVFNASVSGADPAEQLDEEQRKEVDEHNRHFADKHDRGQRAEDDKVDRKFWKGKGDSKKGDDSKKG